MTSYDQRSIALAVGLSCLAGYVDASGFLASGGLFVSFMSGNSTRLSVDIATSRLEVAGPVMGVILLFVLGVFIGTITARLAGEKRKPRVLHLVGMLLIGASISRLMGNPVLSTALLVLAMGAENAVFQRDGEVTIGLTYMTGTLVKLGQQFAGMCFGGPKNMWLPYAALWIGLVSGAILGAWAHTALLLHNLWPPVVAAFGLSWFATTLKPVPATP